MRHIESLKRLIEDLKLPWPETYLVGRDVVVGKLEIILAEYAAEVGTTDPKPFDFEDNFGVLPDDEFSYGYWKELALTAKGFLAEKEAELAGLLEKVQMLIDSYEAEIKVLRAAIGQAQVYRPERDIESEVWP